MSLFDWFVRALLIGVFCWKILLDVRD